MHLKYKIYSLLIIFLFFVSSCSDRELSSNVKPENDSKNLSGNIANALSNIENPISEDKVVKMREEHLSSLSKKVPSFAGYHLDRQNGPHVRDDKLVILVKENERKPSDIAEIINSFNERFGNSIRSFNTASVTIKEVEFSFNQLQAFRDILHSPILKLNGITMIDLAEDQNKILIGIEDETYMNKVESVLEYLPIPDKAVSIKTFERIRPSIANLTRSSNFYKMPSILTHETITSYVRPLTGGLQIEWGSAFFCTLGLIAKYGDEDVFITNSHCSTTPFELGNGAYNQPSNYGIGEEFKDKPFTYFSEENDYVRYSDAVIVELTDLYAEHGTVAFTNSRGHQWGEEAQEQFEIVHRSFPPSERLTYIAIEQSIIDLPVVKTGRSTGSTVGYVDQTCADIPVDEDGYQGLLLCQDIASPLYSAFGDSGSPVYTDYTTDINEGEAKLLGIFWGSNQLSGAYSPITGIRNDFQTQTDKLSFIPMEANILGLNLIGSSGNYTYSSDISNNSGSVNYQWRIKYEGSSSWNTIGTGTNQNINVFTDDDFILKLDATDNTETTTVQYSVAVSLNCSPTTPCEN